MSRRVEQADPAQPGRGRLSGLARRPGRRGFAYAAGWCAIVSALAWAATPYHAAHSQAVAHTAEPPSAQPDSPQEIARLQYTVDQRKSWHTFRGSTKADAAICPEGAVVGLRAIKAFPELDWPGLKPLWKKGTYKYYGPEIWVMFNRETSGDSVHIITAECKNTLEAAIRVVPSYTIRFTLGAKVKRLDLGHPIPLSATVKQWSGGTQAGLRVHFQAMLPNGTAVGEINGPGAADDTVPCDPAGQVEATFTPGVTGKVHLVASVLRPGTDRVDDSQGFTIVVGKR